MHHNTSMDKEEFLGLLLHQAAALHSLYTMTETTRRISNPRVQKSSGLCLRRSGMCSSTTIGKQRRVGLDHDHSEYTWVYGQSHKDTERIRLARAWSTLAADIIACHVPCGVRVAPIAFAAEANDIHQGYRNANRSHDFRKARDIRPPSTHHDKPSLDTAVLGSKSRLA